jgi:hypothetical protein
MYEIKVLLMDEGHDGNYTMLDDGLKLPADKETISRMMEAAKVTEDVIPFTACDYKFRMETMDHVITGSQRLDELNFLAQRLSDLSELERRTFAGAVQLEGCKTPAECINLTYSLYSYIYTVHPHISNEEDLGRCYASGLISQFKNMPPEIMKHLNYEELGRHIFQSDTAVFAGGHYIKRCALNHIEPYSGTLIPDSRKTDTCFMKIRLVSEKDPDGTWLKFPQEGFVEEPGNFENNKEILAALEKLHVSDLSECSISRCVCSVPSLERCIETHQDLPLKDFIWKANNAAVGIEETSEGGEGLVEKCYAALEYENCSDLDLAADISQNLRCYEFLPDQCADLKTYGQLMLAKHYHLTDESLITCFDLEAVGKELMKAVGAVSTRYGIISRTDEPFLYDFSSPSSSGMQMQ